MHGGVHWFFATLSGTHFNQIAGQVAADPLFPIFHAFIDYVRLMRTDCYQFDTVSTDDLDDYMPYSFEVVNCSLDFKMDFSILCDGKRMCSDMDITPRLMYDISSNTQFGVVYELGGFWNDNEELKSMCSANLNSTWWVNSEATTSSHFVRDHGLYSVNRFSAETIVGVVLFLSVCAVVIRYGGILRRKQIGNAKEAATYGAV